MTEIENGSHIVLVVDEIIGQQQVVVKSLTNNFAAVTGIAGATILGDGRVGLILDPTEIAGMGSGRVVSSRQFMEHEFEARRNIA